MTTGFPFPFIMPSEMAITWDSANKGTSVTLSNSNYDAVGAASQCVRAIKGVSGSQKAYWEVVIVTATSPAGRMGPFNHTTYSNYLEVTSQGAGFRPESTSFFGTGVTSGSITDVGGTFANNDVAMFALDMGAGKIWMGKNNTWFNSGNPASGTNHQFTGLTGTQYPGVGFADGTQKYRIRGNSNNITYAPPSGFSVLARV